MSDILSLERIDKRFPGVVALEQVDFTLHEGEVHALMGENGAGKSTLIKVLTGVYAPDGGTMTLEGREIASKTPLEAVELGISTVYQEVNLAPNLSIAENVCLGRESRGAFGIKWGEVRRRAEAALARLGLSLDVRQALGSQSIAIRQMVAIARALDVDAKVLVLDEPTSSLDRDETLQLFDAMRRLRDRGMGIVFVTHFLDQVYEISDRITVLRNGRLVGAYSTSELPHLALVSAMIGRDAGALERKARESRDITDARPLISADQVSRRRAVDDLTVTLAPGEILGFAGLLGSGRTESMRLLAGLDKPDRGSIRRSATLGFCPEDRKADGIFPDLSVRDNIVVVAQARRGWLRRIGTAEQRRIVDEHVGKLRIAAPSVEVPISLLSGGNQQKAILARWLVESPQVLFLDEPTRGIDVGAKFEIENLVEDLRRGGMAFGFVSSELEEVVRWSTKIAVLRDRRMVATLTGEEKREERVMSAIAGSS